MKETCIECPLHTIREALIKHLLCVRHCAQGFLPSTCLLSCARVTVVITVPGVTCQEAAAQLPVSIWIPLWGSYHPALICMDAKGPRISRLMKQTGHQWSGWQFSLLKVWQTQLLRGSGRWPGCLLCVCWRKRHRLQKHVMRAHFLHTLTLIGNFYSSKILSFVKEMNGLNTAEYPLYRFKFTLLFNLHADH